MRKICLFLLLMLAARAVEAQKVDTIHAGDGKLKLKYALEGNQRYIVYLNMDGKKRNIWIWERALSREIWHGQPAIVIRQNWISSDTGFNQRQLFSVTDPRDFRPLYHDTWNPKTGRDAFNFQGDRIVAADTVADISNKTFSMNTPEPAFNWELDLETFSLLPLAEGKKFVINFYHPGSKQGPAWHTYTVTGTEKLKTVSGGEVECYKLYTEYSNNRGNCTWWLSRKTQEVLKMEEHFGKVTRYKIKLAVAE